MKQQKPPPMQRSNLEQIQEHHAEQDEIFRREALLEQLPKLQEHPKVQKQWPPLSKEQLLQMNLEELKEMKQAYQLTIQDQL